MLLMLKPAPGRGIYDKGLNFTKTHKFQLKGSNSAGARPFFLSLPQVNNSFASRPNRHSSSPKNTLTGSQASLQTLKRSSTASRLATSSSVRHHPSRAKLASMRAGVTLLGMTLQPFCSPHARSTCCGVRPLWRASSSSVWFVCSGESVEPRHE